MSIEAIIIEDEPMNAEGLKLLLDKSHKNILVKNISGSVKTAVKSINELKPQVVFLDIKLPDGDGFDVLNNVNYCNFSTIFITAYNQFALRAFDFSAIDYLLKPIKETELARAINKLNIKNPLKFDFESFKTGFDKLPLPTSYGVLFVNLKDIIYCEADNNYTTVYLDNEKKYVVCRTLLSIEKLLEGKNFLRIHRTYIINQQFIVAYIRGKQSYISLQNDIKLPIGEQYKSKVKEWLGVI